MDIIQWMLSLGLSVWLVVLLVSGILGWGFVNMGLSGQWKKGLKVVAVISLLVVLAISGVFATTPAATTTQTDTAATWDIAVTSSDAEVVQLSDYSFKALCDLGNQTGTPDLANGTDAATFTITVSRTDLNVQAAFIRSYISSYGEATNLTTSQTYDGVAKATNGDWDVTYTDSDSNTFINGVTVPVDDTLRSDSYTLEFNWNVNAVAACTLYGGYTVTLLVGSQPITIEVVHNTNSP